MYRLLFVFIVVLGCQEVKVQPSFFLEGEWVLRERNEDGSYRKPDYFRLRKEIFEVCYIFEGDVLMRVTDWEGGVKKERWRWELDGIRVKVCPEGKVCGFVDFEYILFVQDYQVDKFRNGAFWLIKKEENGKE
jgi:hypothetical protein